MNIAPKPVSERRRRKSSGNVIIECVFTLVPMFALLFGMIDIGLMIFRWTTVQNAVREGCRYAVTFQTMTGLHQDASIQTTVQNYAMGFVKITDSPQTIFVKYYSQSNLNSPIGSGGNVPGNIVEVSVQNLSFRWIAPLSGTIASPLYASTPLGLKAYALDIMGGYPLGVSSVTE
ncbi:MAG: TadE/TadG family type IV pilus assembly protein [Bryobacteraceae bacterium]